MRHDQQKFASLWGTAIPQGYELITMTCPNCGAAGAIMDRVSNRVTGEHLRCGWAGSLRVVYREGVATLEPWDR
jgi:predicted RNA-binding Zn-ribbon protein involved in translation (DUF1610 family)